MDWQRRMNRAVDCIEEPLDGEFEYSRAAGFAGCSTWKFQRVFSCLSEYIRRRRLTMAAHGLQCGGVKVIDVAMQYGY